MARDSSGPITRLFRVARPYRWQYLLAVVFFLVKDSPAWVLPLATANIIDVVVSGVDIRQLVPPAMLALLILAQNYPTHMLYVRFSSRATRSLALDLREALTEHLQRLRLTFHQRQGGSVIQSKLVRDVENVELMIQQTLPIALSAVFSLTGALVMTGIIVPTFLAVFALVVPVAMALVLFFRRKSRIHNERFRSQVEQFSTEVGDMSAMLPLARAHAIESASVQRVQASANELRSRGIELDWLNGKFGALTWLSYQILGLIALLLAAGVAVAGIIPITAGQVVLVASYFAVIMGNAIGLLNILPALARGAESLRSIGEVLDDSDIERNDGKPSVEDFDGSVHVAGLTVLLSDERVLDNVSLDIFPGEFVALVGPSGSGKTTLAFSVLGLVPPVSGSITLGGHSIGDIDVRSVRRRISLVNQEPVVMNATVRDNVTFGQLADDEAISRALHASDLTIFDHEGGLDTVLGVNGVSLSVGQRQRLAFARAIYRQPSLLVLDEATSALDPSSQKSLMTAMEQVRGHSSLLVIAHRLQTIRLADRIYVLDGGRVVEMGDHQALMAAKGKYFELVTQGGTQ